MHRLWTWMSGSPYIRVKGLPGVCFEIMPTGYVEKYVMKYGFYESEVFDAVSLYLGEGAVFWDIGSNLGLHAVTAKTNQPKATVIAFEPVPQLRERIRANARLNGVEIEIAEMALADFSGRADLHVPKGNPGGLATLKESYDPKCSRLAVECRRADELIQTGVYASPTVVKLDVEGAEWEVLNGFGEHLRSPSLRAVVFEGAPGLEQGSGGDPVAELLREAGFALQRLQRKEPTAHLLDNYLATRNAVTSAARASRSIPTCSL